MCGEKGELGTFRRDALETEGRGPGGAGELLENSNFTLSAPPDRAELESLEVSAILRMGVVPSRFARCIDCLQRVRGNDERRRNRSASLSSGSFQVSDASCAHTDVSMSELASSDARFTPSSNGSDVAMTDIEENVPSAGQG